MATSKSADVPARRGKVTAEHQAEAAKLLEIWNRTKAERVAEGIGSQEQFGLAFGIGNQAAVGFFLNGKTALSLKAAQGFAEGLKVDLSEFSPRWAAVVRASGAPPAGGPASDMALRLANAFAAAAAKLDDDGRAALFGYLNGEIRAWPRQQQKAAEAAQRRASTEAPPADPKRPRARTRAG